MSPTAIAPRRFGDIVQFTSTVRGGATPYGNSLLLPGSETTLLVDPSLALLHHDAPARADIVFVSHAHEDHLSGLGRYTSTVRTHELELEAVRSFEKQVERYGMPEALLAVHAEHLRSQFELSSRPDAEAVSEGTVLDLGGRTATVVHLPGHTAGHSGLLIEPEGFFYVGDIDLSSFGPYYGDMGSSLAQFEASMARAADVDARWYGTFHHKGVVEGASTFRSMLRAYASVIGKRDETLLAALVEPLTLDEIRGVKLMYPEHFTAPFVSTLEARTTMRHLERLLGSGAVAEVEPGRFRSA